MKNSPRIALDVSQMVYSGHGVGRYTKELARALLTLKTDIHFTYYAGALRLLGSFRLCRTKTPWSKAGWKIVTLPPRLASLIWNYLPLPLEYMVGKQDLIHLSDWTHPRTLAPAVTTVHDLAFIHYPETVHPRVLRVQRRRLNRAIKLGAYFIADSESTKNDLVETYHLKSARIRVVYPGVGSEFVPATSNRIKQVKTKYHLPAHYLLTLGTREPRKNLPRLIAAHQLLRRRDPSLPPLLIAGRYGWGHEEQPVEGVIVSGFIPDSDLPALYSGASAFVYPSLYEGFGFPVLEAMACGTPVVTSNISSLPEVAGSAGVLVDPTSSQDIASGITRALKDAKAFRAKGLKQAAKFTWANTAQQTLAVYHQIINKKY